MSDTTPSQAEGERDDEWTGADPRSRSARLDDPGPPRTTPSQAEGERDDEDEGLTGR
ncbi:MULTISPECIES: hypothetical protein [Streptomycetaceae]|uniref:Uncharacterized protein n=1 Tax=Streptantibioticus cattleyicolor (strain ATCC 35852 / DSM 46488 / JCM 4925 / NBRC 14057 / NRRL 8057) TaxID=1003195 RepID=F8K458_STREN|nr:MULTISPECIES: hypothetical protein [Streptomycetaceae]AEW92599.1 hypothetical protein SCATT_02280 [Streptantibioticus cattleyicolor NRRL 8057 = DSM 46488]CCB72954.1 conserved protein of unknown function [Streptantibioticus cattleyicolor NRRL 8057 = DSM 46488]